MNDALETWSSAIPETLVDAFRSTTPPIIFLGSGFGKEALPAMPTGLELASGLRRELGVADEGIALSELLQFYKNREVGSARSVRQWLESKLHHSGPIFAEPGGAYHLVLTLPGRQILTTNFDLLLDRAAARILPSARWRSTSDPQKYAEHLDTTDSTTKVCGTIHGSFDPAGTADIIATTDDYSREFVSQRWQNAIQYAVRHHR
ncbi:MAG: SIR2 family protein [Ignavibacteriota bacterium]